MRNRPNTTWWDLANELDLMMCDAGPAGCRKKWSPWTHRKGRVDGMGVIHWSGWNKRTTMLGLRRFLKFAACAKNLQYLDEPAWLRTYHASTWATKVARKHFHVTIPFEHSIVDRQRAGAQAKRAKIHLKRDYPTVFGWVHWKPKRAIVHKTGGALDG